MTAICLNGREYALRYSVNAVCGLEDKLGSLAELTRNPLSCLRGLLWCGLMETEKGITLEDAGALLQAHLDGGGSLKQVSGQMAAALEEAGFFQPPAGNGPAPDPA